MKIPARADNSQGKHHVMLTTNDNSHSSAIPQNRADSFSTRQRLPLGGNVIACRIMHSYLFIEEPFTNLSSHNKNLIHLLFVIIPKVVMNSSL